MVTLPGQRGRQTARAAVLAALSVVALALAGAAPAAATFAGRSGDLAFSLDGDVFRVAPEPGASAVNLTGTAATSEFNPEWSPDGTRIAIQFRAGTQRDIRIFRADGSGEPVRVTDDADLDFAPTWSPDGTRIAWERQIATGNRDIVVRNADGTGPIENLTNTAGSQINPAWSPDGERIAYSDSASGQSDIRVMNDDGSTPVTVAGTPDPENMANWSPDGLQLVYDRAIAFSSNKEIFRRNADGSGQAVNITNDDTRDDATPAFSPDGTRIAFVSGATNVTVDVVITNLDGSGRLSVTNDPAARLGIDWQRLAPLVVLPPVPALPLAPPPPGLAPAAADMQAPVLSRLSLTARRFAVGANPTATVAAPTKRIPRGTTIRYALSEPAVVRLTIERRTGGRRAGARCVAPNRANRTRRACTRSTAAGRLRRAGASGANGVRFSGRIGRRALGAGRYRVTATATDPAGNTSRPRAADFVIAG